MLDAVRAHWLRILLGMSAGVFVAFAACLALMIVAVAHGSRWSDATLALVMDGLLLVGITGGGLVGYARSAAGR